MDTEYDQDRNSAEEIQAEGESHECDFCGFQLSESEIPEACPRCLTPLIVVEEKSEDSEDSEESEDSEDSEDDDDMPAFLKKKMKKDEAMEDDSEDDDSEDSDGDDSEDSEDDDSEDEDRKKGGKKILLDKKKRVESFKPVETIDPIEEARFYVNLATVLGESVAKDLASHIVWEANSESVDAPRWLPVEYVEDWDRAVAVGRPKNFLSALSCFRGVIGSR